jgi:hypothetical protein
MEINTKNVCLVHTLTTKKTAFHVVCKDGFEISILNYDKRRVRLAAPSAPEPLYVAFIDNAEFIEELEKNAPDEVCDALQKTRCTVPFAVIDAIVERHMGFVSDTLSDLKQGLEMKLENDRTLSLSEMERIQRICDSLDKEIAEPVYA